MTDEKTRLEANKQLIRTIFEEVLTGARIAEAAQFYAPEVESFSQGATKPIVGIEPIQQMVAAYQRTFPRHRYHILSMVAEGDQVFTHWCVDTTHGGDFNGIAATGRTVHTEGMSLALIREGRVVRVYQQFNEADMMRQMNE